MHVSFADDDWYLCHVTLLAPEEELLSWGMYPYPYLARVDPDARKGTLIYQLVAHYSSRENATAGITYTLIAGRSTLKKWYNSVKLQMLLDKFPFYNFIGRFFPWGILKDTAGTASRSWKCCKYVDGNLSCCHFLCFTSILKLVAALLLA